METKPQLRIDKDSDGYRFYAFPSGYLINQAIGQSFKAYKTPSECEEDLEKFRSLIIENELAKEDGKFVKIEMRGTPGNRRYYFLYYNQEGKCVFERKPMGGYSSKANCVKGIAAVFNAVSHS